MLEQYRDIRNQLADMVPRNPEDAAQQLLGPFEQSSQFAVNTSLTNPNSIRILRRGITRSERYRGLKTEPNSFQIANAYVDQVFRKFFLEEIGPTLSFPTPAVFIAMMDAYEGCESLLARLYAAENIFRTELDIQAAQAIADSTDDLTSGAEVHSAVVTDLERIKAQLIKDKSGKEIIDDYERRIRTNPTEPLIPVGPLTLVTPYIPAFFAAGIRIGGATHQAVYSRLEQT